MRRIHLFAPLALALCAPIACGDDATVFGPDDPACDAWNNEEPTKPVTIRIRNETSDPIYLGSATQGCHRYIDLFLRDEAGAQLGYRYDSGSCLGTCETLREGWPACTDDCPFPPTIYVAPGGVWEETWTGNIFVEEEMPKGCYFEEIEQHTCPRNVVAPEGSYTFAVNAWTTTPNCMVDDCECAPDTNGSCQMNVYEPLSGTPVEATGTLSYPSDAVVEVVFD